MEKTLLTYLELFQIFILCKSQILDVLIVQIHLYFVSLSFLLYMSRKFAPELSLLRRSALAGESQAPPVVLPCVHTFLVLTRQNRTDFLRWHFLMISD